MSDHASYTQSAEYYDAIYGARGKDYGREAEQVHALIQQHARSGGRALLDVACGTGGHLAHLRAHYDVEGLDRDPAMLVVARRKYPGIPFHQADMVDFDLGRRFDAVLCLFSAIAYALTVPRLRQTVQTFARHLRPGGVTVVEPFLRPEDVRPGHLSADFVDEPDLKIARMSLSTVRDRVVTLDFHFLVATPQGIRSFVERHDLAVFTHQEYSEAFQAAGLDAKHEVQGLTGRGLYLGLKPRGS